MLRPKYPGNSFYPPNITRKVYVCSKCFEYFEKESNFDEHLEDDCLSGCEGGLPGRLIFEHAEHGEKYELFEVVGTEEDIFCRNLCMFDTLWLYT